jgi:hypothetical protein
MIAFVFITGLQHVLQTHSENHHNMVVDQTIINALARAAIPYHALFLKETQLMGGR